MELHGYMTCALQAAVKAAVRHAVNASARMSRAWAAHTKMRAVHHANVAIKIMQRRDVVSPPYDCVGLVSVLPLGTDSTVHCKVPLHL